MFIISKKVKETLHSTTNLFGTPNGIPATISAIMSRCNHLCCIVQRIIIASHQHFVISYFFCGKLIPSINTSILQYFYIEHEMKVEKF